MENESAETINLGASIQLSGFRDLDGGKMVVLKKLVGNHVRKISDNCEKFVNLTLVMKPVGSNQNQYEIHGKLVDEGKVITSEAVDRNLFVVVDRVLTKIFNEIKK
ncbi:hypothetical protein KY311_02945 [Candidatus Woesearchaeota archaeon]|nr:hypothetical protein [Candidatus Woesearchaeota archaeon]